jgi:hypothetical protein
MPSTDETAIAASTLMPLSHVKEHLSIAYVRAVTARAGAKLTLTGSPEYGTDVYIQKVAQLPNGKITETGHILPCQLKATTTCRVQDDYVIYDMEVDAYNKLAMWEGTACILVLLRLPKEFEDWLDLDEEHLLLKNCCYWMHITGPPSTNERSQRICIPRSQIFTPEAVLELLEKLKRGAI